MDIFCQIKNKLAEQIIDQSKNFYLLHDGFPLVEGHLLLIPKKHTNCFLSLDNQFEEELNNFKQKIILFLKKNYQEPVIFEHGVIGQTVFHAHLHFVPTKKTIFNYIKKFAVRTPFPKIPYLYYEYKNKKFYYQPKKNIFPGFFCQRYIKILKRPTDEYLRQKDLFFWKESVKKNYYSLYGKNFSL